MTKEEYLRKLKMRLSAFPDQFRRDIIHEFYGEFEKGEKEGKTDEEIIEGLGTIDEVIDNIRMMNGEPSRLNEDGTYKSLPRQEKKTNDFSFENFFDQFTNSLDKSFDILFDTVENKLIKPSDKQLDYYSEFLKVNPDWTELNMKPSIVIAVENSDVSVHVTKGDTFGYLFEPETELLQLHEATLQLYESDTEIGFAVKYGTGNLNITVPDGLKTLRVSLTRGELNILGIDVDSLTAKTTIGDLTVRNVTGNELNFITDQGVYDSGEIKADGLRILSNRGDIGILKVEGTLTLKTDSGDIRIADHHNGNLFASSASGDIEINSEGEIISITGNSGDISLLTNSASPEINVETKSGDIDFRIRNDNFRLAARSTHGEVKNLTDYPIYKQSDHEYAGGTGTGKIMLITKSGDITLR